MHDNQLVTIQNNPFKASFNYSPLDFHVVTDKIYTDKANNIPCLDKKAVIKLDEFNNPVDWWIVGKDYYVKSHKDFFNPIEQKILDTFKADDVDNVRIKTKSARNGRWGLRDYVFPNIGVPIHTTSGHETTIQLRIVCWSGLDGSTANNYMLGAIDSFCTNGQVFTQAADKDEAITKLYKRNSKLFDMKQFAITLTNAAETFYAKAKEYQHMADTRLGFTQGNTFIDNLKSLSDSKKKGLKELLRFERVTRGANVFALHSALTNYSSHKNVEHFQSRKSKHGDMEHKVMFDREEEVLNILESKQWKELLVAA